MASQWTPQFRGFVSVSSGFKGVTTSEVIHWCVNVLIRSRSYYGGIIQHDFLVKVPLKGTVLEPHIVLHIYNKNSISDTCDFHL